jgi:hypothetical protein
MTSPVSWRYNPYGNYNPEQPRSSGPSHSTSPQYSATNTSSTSPSSTSGPYAPGYIPTTTEPAKLGPNGLILLPSELAAEGRNYGQKYGIPKEGDEVDPRAEVIQLSTGVQDLDSLVQALATQPIDIAGAKGKVTEADDRQTQFFKEVTSNLSPEQARSLKPLYEAARTAEGSKKETAQTEYITALDGMLSPGQRKTLLTLQRASEDAQLHLQGQLIGQRIKDARAGNGPGEHDPKGMTSQELESLALADARALLAQKEQMRVDRKLQDLYGLIMTPENRQKMAPQQQALFDAHQKLQADPKNADLQKKFKDAQSAFDNAFYNLIDPKDRTVIKGFESYQRHLQSVAGTLNDEARGERNFYELRTLTSGPKQPTALERQEFTLAQHQLELIRHNRSMRSLALRSAGDQDNDDLKKELDQAMVTALRKNGDLTVETRQFNYDFAVHKHSEWTKSGQNTTVPFAPSSGDGTQPISYNGPTGSSSVPPTLKAVNEAKTLLDQAKEQRQKLEEELKPEQPKKSWWDRALDIAMGVGEILGGIALMAFSGWTGIGAVAGGAIVVDGLFRFGHSVSDAVNGTVTDAPLSALIQKAGVSRETANRVDTGVNLLATVPVGIGGAAMTVFKSSSMLLKGSGLLGGLVVADGAQAGTRSIITNEAVSPFAVQQLTDAGLSQTQANYVVALGSLVGIGGLTAGARARAPGTVKPEFLTYDPANLPKGVTASSGSPVRIADWHTRGAPKDLRTEIATKVLGPDASPRQVRQVSNSMRGNPLVVLKTVADDGSQTVVGAATVRTNSTGRWGRDAQGNRIDPKSAEIKPLLGDGEVKSQTIAAGAEGVKQFTKQRGVFWQTVDPEDSSWVPDANLKHQRVRRDAPTLISQLPEDQRPWGTHQVIEQPGNTQSKLKQLAAIPEGDRVNWPVGSRDLVYGVSYEKPLSSPAWLKPAFLTFDPAKVPEGVTASPGSPVRFADWHTRGAPKHLRTEIAEKILGPGASPQQVKQVASSMRGNPLVVLKAVGDDGTHTVVGAATVRTNGTGRSGGNVHGTLVDPKSAEIKVLLGDGEVKAQTIAAGAEGVKLFTAQRGVFWQTVDPNDSSWVPAANSRNQPGASGDLVYTVNYERPWKALYGERLGKLVHPMRKDSYLASFNLNYSPVNYVLSRLKPQAITSPYRIGEWPNPTEGGPTRVATFYPAGTVPKAMLPKLAQMEVDANAGFGNKTSFNNHPSERLPGVAQANLAKLDLVVMVESADPDTPIAAAALTSDFKGFRKQNVAAYPWLSDTHYKPGTTYLGHVFTDPTSKSGLQIVQAAHLAARRNGARHFDFLTQWSQAQKLYKNMGARPEGYPHPGDAPLPMTVYSARFGANAGEYLTSLSDPKALRFVDPRLKKLIADSNGSPEVLQAKLDRLNDLGLAHMFISGADNGSLLVRYSMDFNPTPASWRMQAQWKWQDTKYWIQEGMWEPIRKPVLAPARALGAGGRWLNDRVNPYSLTAFEPGTVRSALRSAGYASSYGIKQSWTTYKGAVIDVAALQAITGNVQVDVNNYAGIIPFNGLPNDKSRSVTVYFPWTGTMVSGWVTKWNARGPAPIDDTGLQPLARASAPLTDPKGPKGAGFLTAARAALYEGNIGIRWFGNNSGVSAVTAGSIRLSPVNINGRLDVPIQSGGPHGVQVPHSHTWIMPSFSHAFYWGRGGVIVRTLHVNLSGAWQSSAFTSAARANAYKSSDHSLWGSKGITTGTGYFFTLNPAYGKPDFKVG